MLPDLLFLLFENIEGCIVGTGEGIGEIVGECETDGAGDGCRDIVGISEGAKLRDGMLEIVGSELGETLADGIGVMVGSIEIVGLWVGDFDVVGAGVCEGEGVAVGATVFLPRFDFELLLLDLLLFEPPLPFPCLNLMFLDFRLLAAFSLLLRRFNSRILTISNCDADSSLLTEG